MLHKVRRGIAKWVNNLTLCYGRIVIFCHCARSVGVVVHDDVIKWIRFPRYWPFVRGIHRSPVNSAHKGQWHGAMIFSLVCAWINGWVNNNEAGDLRRHRAHYDVTVMYCERLVKPSLGLRNVRLIAPTYNQTMPWFQRLACLSNHIRYEIMDVITYPCVLWFAL